MSIFSVLFNGNTARTVANVAKRGAVKFADAVAGKVEGLERMCISLERNPKVDEFCRVMREEGANVVGDNIATLSDNAPGRVYRVVTARRPSGETISRMYPMYRGAEAQYEEVRALDGSVKISRFSGSDEKLTHSIATDARGNSTINYYGHLDTTCVPIDIQRTLLADAEGITGFANQSNTLYQEMLANRMVR